MKYVLLMLILFSSMVSAQITDYGPEGIQNSNDITLFVTTDGNETCSYDYGVGINLMSGTLTHEEEVTLVDGSYNVTYNCSNSTNMTASFTVDTTPSIITITNFPDEIKTQPYQIEIKTNEAANCKYSETDQSYEVMTNSFSRLSSTKHYSVIDNKAQGLFTYYIKCKDGSNQISNYVKEFFVNRPPTATVSIESDPLPAGTYEVTVLTSETLSQVPSLYYYFNDDSTLRPVALTGNGNLYTGYLILEDTLGEKVGTFTFTGYDSSGLQGQVITNGKIFLVDTKLPEAPDSVEAYMEDGDVIVEWTYEKDFDEFVIYRSTSPNVEKVDEYKTVSKKEYEDKNVEEGVTYFYKIAVKDDAGNIGVLSEEVEIFVLETEQNEELSPKLKYKLDSVIDLFETELFDYQEAKRLLNDKKTPEIAKIETSYKVFAELDNAVIKLQTIINELKKLEDQDLSESGLDNIVDKYQTQLEELRKTVVTDINIVDQKSVAIEPTDDELNAAIAEYLLGTDMNEEELQNYTKSMKALQVQVDVQGEIISADLVTKSGTNTISFIEKDISSVNPVDKANIIEIIPQDFIRRAGELKYSNNPQILKDNMVQWSLNQLTGQTLSYWQAEERTTNLISLTSTVVLTPPVRQTSNNQITGNVVDETPKDSSGFWKTFSVVFLSLVVISLLGYYVASSSKGAKAPVPKTVNDDFLIKKFHHVLNSAQSAVDNVQTEKAKILYQDVYKLYLALPENQKASAYNYINLLYSKIKLLNQISKQHELLDNKQTANLAKENEYLKGMVSYALEGSQLRKYAESSIEYFNELAL